MLLVNMLHGASMSKINQLMTTYNPLSTILYTQIKMTKHKQVNFTTVMDYRQTFTVDIDFEALKKEFIEKHDFDEEEVQSLWESDEELYNHAWDMIMENPDKFRDQAWGEGDYDNEVVFHDCII